MTDFERRMTPRHRYEGRVRVQLGKTSKLGECRNVCTDGACLEVRGLSLQVGDKVILTFVLDLGRLTKLNIKRATVIHTLNGLSGFKFESIVRQNTDVVSN